MSGNISLNTGHTLSIGDAIASDGANRFTFSDLKVSNVVAENVIISNPNGTASIDVYENMVQFKDKNSDTMDLVTSQVVFGTTDFEVTMKASDDQVMFLDDEGKLVNIGNPIVTDIEMPLEVFEDGYIKFKVDSLNDETVVSTTDDRIVVDNAVHVAGKLTVDEIPEDMSDVTNKAYVDTFRKLDNNEFSSIRCDTINPVDDVTRIVALKATIPSTSNIRFQGDDNTIVVSYKSIRNMMDRISALEEQVKQILKG